MIRVRSNVEGVFEGLILSRSMAGREACSEVTSTNGSMSSMAILRQLRETMRVAYASLATNRIYVAEC
jgi:hypothetical protein